MGTSGSSCRRAAVPVMSKLGWDCAGSLSFARTWSETLNEEQWNWAGNLQYGGARWHYPGTVLELQELIERSKRLKVVGSRHSFNAIADSTVDIVSLDRLAPAITIDPGAGTVTVGAGVNYGLLSRRLHEEGYAIHNLASLPHISVAGACATATHGSGDKNGVLATAVYAIEMIDGRGERVVLSRDADGETFRGVVVGLGALGVAINLTLEIGPTFDVRQDVYESLPYAELEAAFDTITSSAYSVSLFTDWQGDVVNQVWCKRKIVDGSRIEPPSDWFGSRLVTADRHPIETVSAENCTPQLGLPGPWHERLPHFRLEFTPSSGEELQSEYIVPRRHALDAIRAIRQLKDRIRPLLQISEIRTIAADDLWMSPCYQEPSVGIHFTWYKNWPAVRSLLPIIEKELEPFEARPHWGKLFTTAPDRVRLLYAKLPGFVQLARQYDPQGKFRNSFLNRYVYGNQ